MTPEREKLMLAGAKILAGTPFNELPEEELDIMLNHGNIIEVSSVELVGLTKTLQVLG